MQGALQMNAVQLLKEDHERAERLFHQFQLADDDGKAEIATEICRILRIHARIEEELLYPAARDALGEEGEDLIDEALVEHSTAKRIIGEIESAHTSDEFYHAKVKALGEYVKRHVREEEGEVSAA
jgi:hemerythrin superfamily protein